jgi:hypothetical protein
MSASDCISYLVIWSSVKYHFHTSGGPQKTFCLIQDDDVDHVALLLKFCQLTTKRDDMSGAGSPCVVERLGGIRVFLGHHLTPVCEKVKRNFIAWLV